MSIIKLPVIIHGVTGRMGQIALRALQQIGKEGWSKLGDDLIQPIPIAVARNREKLEQVAREKGCELFATQIDQAYEMARKLNPQHQVYHNTLSTGVRKDNMLAVLPALDSKTTAVYMEKPLASNYADGLAIVAALEKGGFHHGVVHHMLATPGVLKALELMPKIKPLHSQMLFGYEVGAGFSDNKDFSGQRPDFNWTFAQAGGGIILDMCHEGYLSQALFGTTERLSAVARLLLPKRVSTDGHTVIDCDVEDYSAYRREHANGVVNTSIWTWFRRINSEFGPLEITVEGENGTLVFGLYGLKVQWKEAAPANRWERSVVGEKIEWRNYWQYLDLTYRDPFALELSEYLLTVLTGEPYRKNAIQALNILGEVEALYDSAAQSGVTIDHHLFWRYPKTTPPNWQPERLQGKLVRTA
jgi:predicted dehydrogenase